MKLSSCVVQEDAFGCVVAGIATILQCKYQDVRKHIQQDFSSEGIGAKVASDYLSGYGFTSVWAAADYYSSYSHINQLLTKPFAEIHLISLRQYINTEIGHSVVMDEDGKIFDPTTGKLLEMEYLFVNSIFGFWYPKGWEFKETTYADSTDFRTSISNR